jgi:hypothetical protein
MRRRRNEVRENPRVCGGFLSDVAAFSYTFIRASPGIASCPNVRRPVSAAAVAHDELDVENLTTWAWPPPADEAVEGLHRADPDFSRRNRNHRERRVDERRDRRVGVAGKSHVTRDVDPP